MFFSPSIIVVTPLFKLVHVMARRVLVRGQVSSHPKMLLELD